ncbi:MAG: type II toxin-antitoxin system RatA family toxin [Pseudomonadota bacterium]|nr:type II toxin-antitoxin system RatA family toxin [Pseudomonadota bacterium]
MPSFRTTRQVRHSPIDMFKLVADVEKYPEFLPLCEDLRIRRRVQSGEGIETLVAEMSVGYKSIRETFTTRVTLDEPRLRILVEYVEGPFSFLENRWTFKPDPAGCAVEFYIAYEFKSFALRMLMGAMFDRAFRTFAEAFEARADVIYRAKRAARA